MSFVTMQPEQLTLAAGNLQDIGSAISTGNAAAEVPTAGVVPAAADEVSALIAMRFTAHAAMYQGISTQATAIRDQFVTTLAAAADSYAATEAANAAATG